MKFDNKLNLLDTIDRFGPVFENNIWTRFRMKQFLDEDNYALVGVEQNLNTDSIFTIFKYNIGGLKGEFKEFPGRNIRGLFINKEAKTFDCIFTKVVGDLQSAKILKRYNDLGELILEKELPIPYTIWSLFDEVWQDSQGNWYFSYIDFYEENLYFYINSLMLKLNKDLELQWIRPLSEDSHYESAWNFSGPVFEESHDGKNTIVAGEASFISTESGKSDLLPTVCKISPEGQTIWESKLKIIQQDSAQHFVGDITQTPDGSYLVYGYIRYLYPIEGNKAFITSFLFKIDDDGNVGDVITGTGEVNTPNTPINIFPNPASNLLNLEFDSDRYEGDQMVHIRDLHGRLLLQQVVTSPRTQIDVNNLEKGLYTISILEGSNVIWSNQWVKL